MIARDSDSGETTPPFGAPSSPSGLDASDTLSVDADCSSGFSSSLPVSVAGVALRSIGIFIATSAVAYFLFPFLASDPQTYGMGGLQQQLWDVLAQIEWDENRILSSLTVSVALSLGYVFLKGGRRLAKVLGQPILIGAACGAAIVIPTIAFVFSLGLESDSTTVNLFIPALNATVRTLRDYGSTGYAVAFGVEVLLLSNILLGGMIGSLVRVKPIGRGVGILMTCSAVYLYHSALIHFLSVDSRRAFDDFLSATGLLAAGIALIYFARRGLNSFLAAN